MADYLANPCGATMYFAVCGVCKNTCALKTTLSRTPRSAMGCTRDIAVCAFYKSFNDYFVIVEGPDLANQFKVNLSRIKEI
jgi:hypothetical protein